MNRADFESIAMPHLDALYNAAVKMAGNPADAEDLVQETYLNAWRFFDRFQEGSNVKAWLFKILNNRFIDRHRKRAKEPPPADVEDADIDYLAEPGGWGVRNSGAPERELFDRFVEDDVRRALAALPEEFRQAFVLYDLEGFSYQETAEMLDCSIGTVKSRLFRARKSLQKNLFDYAKREGRSV